MKELRNRSNCNFCLSNIRPFCQIIFPSLHSTLPLPLCYTLLMIPPPSGHITPGRTPLHAKELNSPHSYYNPSEFSSFRYQLQSSPQYRRWFSSPEYVFSWLYMTPFIYRRSPEPPFSPVPRARVLGGESTSCFTLTNIYSNFIHGSFWQFWYFNLTNICP